MSVVVTLRQRFCGYGWAAYPNRAGAREFAPRLSPSIGAPLTNLLLLVLEAVLYFGVMSALFRLRHRFGIGVFFCALGAMHFLETYLAAILYVELPLGITVSPGSVVLFAGKLVMLLLVYIREDAASVRQPIYGLLLGNFLIVGLVALMRFHDLAPAISGQPDFALMDEMSGLMVWGTILLFVDSILIILVYERSAAWFPNRQTLRIILSAAIVLSFDQLGFFIALHVFIDAPISVLYSGWIAKMGAALIFGVMAGLYLRHIEVARLGHAAIPRLSDVFDTLTYRERYEALLETSGRDSLTGLFHRGRLDREGRQTVAAAIAAHRPISLLIIDIDHFKALNDRHGHATGDEALRRIAQRIGEATRPTDSVYRYGGEEFVLLADGLTHTSAMIAAERLRRRIATTAIEEVAEGVTASIGVATASEDGRDLSALFEAADARLYAAKAAGRDRVCGRPSVVAGEIPADPARRPA